jgi:monofunctional glycosyltransferase
MLPPQRPRGDFTRRRDRSLGWQALESKQAAALERCLESLPSLPEELRLPAAPTRRRKGFGEVLGSCLLWVLAIQLCYLLATSLLISVYRFVDPPATVLIAYRKWYYGWKVQAPRPVSLRKVPRYIRSMLISVEDGKFYEHHGLDFEAFARAREINKRLGKPLYGGSTLTMQVARTLFLVPEKSYIRKYLEILTALELEALLPKDRILELYFGYAEWGKGLFGMEAASSSWYGRGLAALSRDEAARLVALLSSPVKYSPSTLQKNGILRERYRYLSQRYDRPAGEAEAASAALVAPPQGEAGAVEAPPPATEAGVPSPEQGSELESPRADLASPEPGAESEAGLTEGPPPVE